MHFAARFFFGIAVAIGTSGPVSASVSSGGQITYVSVDQSASNGYIFIVSGPRSTKPACATEDGWVIVSPASDKGKAIYATILTANAADQTVTVTGTNACDTIFTTREVVSFISVN
jgi:hypothetical protein